MAALPRRTPTNAMPGAGYQGSSLPMGEGAEAFTGDEEIELEDEESPEDEDEYTSPFVAEEHFTDLTPMFSDEELKRIGNAVVSRYESDAASRDQWIQNCVKGLKILGINLDNAAQAMFINGGCTATHPLCLETGVKLQQKLSSELFPVSGPTKTRIFGSDNEETMERANRVKQYSDYQIMCEMSEFEDFMDKTLLYTALFGTCFKKTYRDDSLGRNVSEMVRADLFVVNQSAPNLEMSERFTHMNPISTRTMKKRISGGFYRELEISDPDEVVLDSKYNTDGEAKSFDTANGLSAGQIDLGEFDDEFQNIMGVTAGATDNGFLVLDHYCYWDFGEDYDPLASPTGEEIPYIISVDQASGNVLRICRDWAPGDYEYKRQDTFTAYNLIPFMGLYALGLIHLLGNFNIALTAIMRSLIDSGTLANLQGGYKLKSARIANNSDGYSPGEWKDVEGITGNGLGDAFLPHQFKEPSQVLFALLGFLNERGAQFASATDQVVADNPGYGNVGTTTALLDMAEKLYTGIYKRIRKSFTKELKILGRLNYEYLGDTPYPFPLPKGGEAKVIGEDFNPAKVNVEPSADPDVPSQAKRASLDQLKINAMATAKQADPNMVVNFKPVIKSLFLNLDPQMDMDEVFPDTQEAKPQGPIEDISAVISGTPIKAFPGQNHQAHIITKNAWIEDPNQGASKIMAPFVSLLQANIREHMLMAFQESIGAMATGVASDPKTIEMVQAEAAKELSRMSKVTATMDTPEATVAQAVKVEADAKMASVDQKSKKDLMDFITSAIKLQLEQLKLKNESEGDDADRKLGILESATDNATKFAIAKMKPKPKPSTKK